MLRRWLLRLHLLSDLAENSKWSFGGEASERVTGLSEVSQVSVKNMQSVFSSKSLIRKVSFKTSIFSATAPWCEADVSQCEVMSRLWEPGFPLLFPFITGILPSSCKLHMSYPYVSRLSLWRHLYLKRIKSLWIFGLVSKGRWLLAILLCYREETKMWSSSWSRILLDCWLAIQQCANTVHKNAHAHTHMRARTHAPKSCWGHPPKAHIPPLFWYKGKKISL